MISMKIQLSLYPIGVELRKDSGSICSAFPQIHQAWLEVDGVG